MPPTTSKTFDVTNPSRHVTDPKDYGTAMRGAGLPKHLYRFSIEESATAVGEDGKRSLALGCLIVAWKGATPVYNEMAEVTTREDLRAHLDAGWSDAPVMPTETPAPTMGRRKREDAA